MSQPALLLIATVSCAVASALQPGALLAPSSRQMRSYAAASSRRVGSPKAIFVTKQNAEGQMYTDVEQLEDCAIVDPDAVNLLACHFIAHHRQDVVEFVNKVAFPERVLGTIDGFIGDLLSVKNLRFDITGPLEPQNFFHCYEVSVTRALDRPDLVHADLTLEYKNQLCFTLDALRFRGAVRGNSTAANLYRWVSSPFKGTSELKIRLSGHAEGVAKLRLTMQTSQDVAFPTLAHIKITDASAMSIKLDDYDLNYLGPTGALVRFVAGQLPLRRFEGVINDSVQGVFKTYADGWPINGGVREVNVGAWSRRKRRGPQKQRGFPKITQIGGIAVNTAQGRSDLGV